MTTHPKIRIEVDPELADLVPGFLRNREDDVETLRKAIATRDAQAARVVGHRLRGVAGGYGFEELGAMGARIEDAARLGRMEDVALVVAEMVEHLARVEVHLTGEERPWSP